jgi:site-specific recombinase XerD
MAQNVYKPKNSKHYYLRVSIDGKSYRESLQTTSARVAEKLARKRIKELRSEAELGNSTWLFNSGFVKFYDALDKPSSDHGWSNNTRARYQTSLRQIGRVMAEIFEDRGVDIEDVVAWEVTTAEVSEYVTRRKTEDGVSIATINRDLTAFTHLMSAIKNDRWIESNPVLTFEKNGMRESLPDIIMPTDGAIGTLAERAPGTLAYFPAFLNETGGRTTEIAKLKWDDVQGMGNPVEGIVTVTLRETKGGKVRTILLRQQAIDILLLLLRMRSNRSAHVFWNKTEDGYYRSVSNLFWEYGQETKFGSRLHDIRHKFAIERLKEGWSVYKVQKYIGHGSVTTTERYYFRYLSQEQQTIANADGNVGL